MSRVLSNRLRLVVFLFLGGALAQAGERGTQRLAGDDAPFSLGTFRNIAREQTPCVVHIVSERNETGSGEDGEPSEDELPTKGIGSGLILSSDGLILTNDHVVAGNSEVQITLHDGTVLPATLVGRDPEMDVALLRAAPPHPLRPAVLGDSRRLEVGDWVVAIGSPYGLSNSVSVGIVSALGRNLRSGNYDDFIQTDAAINIGNSGGPLFDIRGEVIGINAAILTSGGGSSGIGFAIPIHDLLPVLDQLRRYGHVTRGWLGVALEDPPAGQREALGLESGPGPVVTDVWPDSPAARAGIRSGDVIIAFGRQTIDHLQPLLFAVANAPVGSRIPLQVLRSGERLTLGVLIATKPQDTEVEAGGVTVAEPLFEGLDPNAPAVATEQLAGSSAAQLPVLR
jgi:serine protease Do